MRESQKTVCNLTAFYLSVILFTLVGIVLGNRTVTVISQNRPVYRKHCIIIDAGHGGEDGGAISCTGAYESRINLDIALRLNDCCHLLGVDTLMVRSEDVAVYRSGNTIAQKKVSDLRERVKMVNSKGADAILVSIHQNYFTNGKYCGAQVFYGAGQGSEALAKTMQTSLVQHLNKGSRRLEKRGEGIYILEKTSCPAILIECGFLSNPAEEEKLRTEKYQKDIAVTISTILVGNLCDA